MRSFSFYFLLGVALSFGTVSTNATSPVQPNIPQSFVQSQIYQNGVVISPTDFLQNLASQDYIILGEYHDSKPQHALASDLLKRLGEYRPQGSLLMEMLSVEQQANIDKAQKKPPKFAKLPEALNWQSSWDWGLYGQIVAQPFLYNYPLVATNLTKTEVKTLMQGAEPLKGYESTTGEIKAVLKQRIIKAHGFKADEISADDNRIIDNMVSIQQFRDRRMAEKIMTSPKPALLLTGNYHAQKSVGVPKHLIDLQMNSEKPLKGVVVLMVKSLDDFNSQFDKADADFVWVIHE